ncbi:MAG: hypothetical protein MI684_08585 [Chlorobiales bacterium]|nr:hypothetical protein [Chlorobiales bacterium]
MKNSYNSYIKRDDVMTLDVDEARIRVVTLQSQLVKLKKERAKLIRQLSEKQVTIKNLWSLLGKMKDDRSVDIS